jgi:predicted nucleic acid-binding protein
MLSFDTNVLVYATAALADDRVSRAQDLLARDAGNDEHPAIAESC